MMGSWMRKQSDSTPLARHNAVADVLFFLFFAIYMTIATEYALPEISRWLIAAVLFCYSLAVKFIEKDRFRLLPWPFIWLIVAFVLGLIPLQYGLFYSIQRIFSFFLVVGSLFLFLDRQEMTQQKIVRYFTLFSWFMMILLCVQAVWWLAEGFPIGNFRGGYVNKNTLNAVLLFAGGCSLWLFVRHPKLKILTIPLMLFSVLLIVADGSRVGIVCLIGLIAAAPFIFFPGKTVKNRFRLMLSLFILVGAGVLVVNYVDIPALDRLLGEEDLLGSMGMSRGFVWDEAWRIVKEHPLFGWGQGAVGYFTFVENPTQYLFGVHSSYFTILIENGIVGSLFYLGFGIFMAWKLWTSYKKQPHTQLSVQFCQTLAVICLLFLLACVAEAYLFSMGSPPAVFFWFTLLCLYRYLEEGTRQPQASQPAIRWRWR